MQAPAEPAGTEDIGPWRRECSHCGTSWPPVNLNREECPRCGDATTALILTVPALHVPPPGSLGELMQEWAAQP